MVGNPYRWKASIPQLENRNANAGCLLSLLFVVPYLAKSEQIGTITLTIVVLMYVTLVVPLLTGILSTKSLLHYLRCTITVLTNPESWKDFIRLIIFISQWCHFLYGQLESVHATVMQVVFNLAAEKVLCPEERLCSLYVLLFYCVIAYLQRALQNRPWAHLLAESSTAEFLKLTTAFMIVRLGKGVVMTLVLLTFSLQLNHMEPSVLYVAVTFAYFCLTQYQTRPLVLRTLTRWLSKLDLQWLEGLEKFWIPFLLNCIIIGFSISVAIAALFTKNNYFVLLILSYTNIFVPVTEMLGNSWTLLAKERQKIIKFPMVSWKNPEVRFGGLCAICLDKLRLLSARVTRCGHVFHGACIRQSLQYSSRCPLCKSQL